MEIGGLIARKHKVTRGWHKKYVFKNGFIWTTDAYKYGM